MKRQCQWYAPIMGSNELVRPDSSRVILVAVLGLFIAVGPPGCGGSSLEPVSGTVTIDGAPVGLGTITLQPLEGTKASSAGAPIENGRFDMPRDYGAMPGKYLARIVVQEPTGNVIVEMGQEIPEAAEVPIKEAAGIEIEIAKGRTRNLEFNLTRAARAGN